MTVTQRYWIGNLAILAAALLFAWVLEPA